jgi:electron transfer flavoprotein alpha subunit
MNEVEQPTLIVVEHDGQQARPASMRAVGAARKLGAPFSLICLGHQIDAIAGNVARLGALKVYVADQEALAQALADRWAHVVADVAEKAGFQTVLAASSTFARDLLPRIAALLDAPMLSDVIEIERGPDGTVFRRPINAGCEVATVTLQSGRRVLTVRPGAFEMPERAAQESSIEAVAVSPQDLPCGATFVSRELRQSLRPDLSEASVVVAGGRPIKDRESFEQLVGRLADALGGAVGATRALVDAGVVPNDWQIGQTGKVVAPELYIAVGISGAVQHLAGVMDARTIVAINKDATAPMMKVATYALAGDLFEIVPSLIKALLQRD